MKTQTIKDLFNLLKTALWQDKQYVKNIADVDWNCLYDLAKEQCVLALIADSFRFLTPKQYDSKGSMKWACYVIKQERENRIMNLSVGKVFGLLKEMGLSPILMKGQAFAANYPFPLHRQCGDIDVYFKKHNDCYKAVAWAKTKDKTAAISDDNKRDNQHFCFTLNRNIIELHYHLCLLKIEHYKRDCKGLLMKSLIIMNHALWTLKANRLKLCLLLCQYFTKSFT